MPQNLTCPHCETALSIADGVTASGITCPRCLGLIPYRGSGGTVRALDVDAELRRDRRGTGWGIVGLVMLVCVGAAFAVSLAMSASKTAGRYGDNLLTVWFLIGGVGGLVVFCLTAALVGRFFRRQLAEESEPSSPKRTLLGLAGVLVALLTGIVAAVVVFGLTCGAILGGAAAGGL